MTLFACMCNQPQRLAEALGPVRPVLVAPPPIARWGLAYAQSGDVLLVRTPKASAGARRSRGAARRAVDRLCDRAVGDRRRIRRHRQHAAVPVQALDVRADRPARARRRDQPARRARARVSATQLERPHAGASSCFTCSWRCCTTRARLTIRTCRSPRRDVRSPRRSSSSPPSKRRRRPTPRAGSATSSCRMAARWSRSGSITRSSCASCGRAANAPSATSRSAACCSYRTAMPANPKDGFEDVPAQRAVLIQRDLQVSLADLSP